MAFSLSATAEATRKQTRQEPQLILEVEGVDLIFGTQPVLEYIRWDDGHNWDDPELYWDGSVEADNSESLISLNGTTNKFTQQLNVDRASGTGSVSSMKIALVDKNSIISKAFSFDNIGDILGKRASVYLSYRDTVFPDDAIPVLRGFIDNFGSIPGRVNISVTHPENIKRQTIFKRYASQLTASIDNVQTTIPVTSTEGFIESSDLMTSYIRIDDEFMEVTAINSSTELEVVRERLNTIANPHDNEADVSSTYQFQGLPIDIALRIMHSEEGNEFFISDERVKSFEATGSVINFESYDIGLVTGLVEGDKIEIEGSNENDGVYTFVTSGKNETQGFSFIIVEESLENEVASDVTFKFKSQYNVLNEGLGMLPFEVATQDFIGTADFFSAQFFDYNLFVIDTIKDAKTWLDEEVFFPQGLYSIPRKAASSIKFTAPPLSIEDTPVLNLSNILNIENLEQERTIHRFYYNEVLYNYNFDLLQEKLLDTLVSISNQSKSRITKVNKTLSIEAPGVDRGSAEVQSLTLMADRLLKRYRFAARFYSDVEITYKEGFRLEVGDSIILGGEDTKQVDLQTGLRSGELVSYEIINKSLSVKRGKVVLRLMETGFGLEGRRGVFSPSSKVLAGSSTSQIVVGNIFENFDEPVERNKYERLFGCTIRIYSEDFDYDETATLEGFSETNPNALSVSGLSTAPLEGYTVELARYEDQPNSEAGDLVKLKYTFTTTQAELTAITSPSEVEVDDATDLFEGLLIYVHSDDYDRESQEVEIDTIVGQTVTFKEPLNITPQVGDKLESLGFSDSLDGGYRFI